ncbi:FAD-dependent oxidoreductase [Pseudomonas abieticivorans]|uniref:FAD-dependent oxidoreductase n=1 Tax=Pseudomonas abieticivorans TaxID=2931382 RepID=UPI0020BFE2AC|nr:FAD-dependent oxidoreductase [Pseudomonas sp. PIA16]
MTLHAVAPLNELPEDRATRFELGDLAVVLVRQAGQVSAYQADCPHAGAPLEDGAVCEGFLICPWHKAAFAIDDGRVCEPPALVDLKRYAARVVGDTVWVDDQPMANRPTPTRPDKRCLVVIGAGAAGTAAVATLHRQGFAGRLVWLDREPQPAYDRTALSKFVIAGQLPPHEVPPLLDEDARQAAHIQQAEVKAIDIQARTLHLNDGQALTYDAALLATGGIAQRPDMEGATLPGTFVLRSRADAEKILAGASPGSTAVIVGDSFIGLEAASALSERGLKVHVVSRHAVPLARQVGERIGQALKALHQQHGVVFHGPCEPVRLAGNDHVHAVHLDDGTVLAADLVLFGTGVKPATACVQSLRLAEDGSVNVDAHLRAAEGLWAAGDIVTFPLAGKPVRIEHWRVAQQHGVLAALNMLGERHRYADVPFFWTYHYGQNLEVLGHATGWSRIVYHGEPEHGAFIALLCEGEQVVSVVARDESRAMAVLAQKMKRALTVPLALAMIKAVHR